MILAYFPVLPLAPNNTTQRCTASCASTKFTAGYTTLCHPDLCDQYPRFIDLRPCQGPVPSTRQSSDFRAFADQCLSSACRKDPHARNLSNHPLPLCGFVSLHLIATEAQSFSANPFVGGGHIGDSWQLPRDGPNKNGSSVFLGRVAIISELPK